MIYAITVTVYPFPPDFYISRFVSFYNEFRRPDLTWDETVGLLKISLDIISGLRELSLAKIGIPRSVFFLFSVTWLTIFLFLLVFRLLHVHCGYFGSICASHLSLLGPVITVQNVPYDQ